MVCRIAFATSIPVVAFLAQTICFHDGRVRPCSIATIAASFVFVTTHYLLN
jgi:hypothetical protein